VLDIGCGPRGSLDWATTAGERIGLDPLAADYTRLNGRRGGTSFVTGVAEAIPFPDRHFDIVATFNSLDHVDDFDKAVAEISRVTRPGGVLLILTDVAHAPTFAEPQNLSWEVLERFRDDWDVVREQHFLKVRDNMMHTLDEAIEFDPVRHAQEVGTLSALLRRR
jgi:ubiquinone/menaquinone biosynthesis C-methylase UbiE